MFWAFVLATGSRMPLNSQKILTECGCYIKTRLGLHEVNENLCAPGGLILLEVYGGDAAVAEMESRL